MKFISASIVPIFNMRNYRQLLGWFIVPGILIFWFVYKREADLEKMKSPANRPHSTERRERTDAGWAALFSTPIGFYGKVIDNNNDPVEGARVAISIADHVFSGNTKFDLTSDPGGMFHASGRGLSIVVTVSKEGYYDDNASGGNFTYAAMGGSVERYTDPEKPAIFVLHKKGKGERLIKIRKFVRFKKDGSPVTPDLANGKLAGGAKAALTMEVCQRTKPGSQIPMKNSTGDFAYPSQVVEY